ncbi:MAG: hypothetical protein D3924_18965 [Candidatus Electrothrix sp. AR4]|nr:hypothetical protein [Candidatus Electrothrix sp. AR4]
MFWYEEDMAAGSVAVLGGQGLGDNLLELVLLENARLAGWQATMFSTRMCELSNWFPLHRFEPTVQAETADQALAGFQLILFPKSPWLGVGEAVAASWIDYGRMYQEHANRAEDMARISGEVFDLDEPTRINGIRPPASLQHRRHQRRVCIHPTSAETNKNWLPKRFLALAARLLTKGFEPVFIMSAAERQAWQPVIGESFPLHTFADVDQCAAFLYESGYFIGNDSGGGHLASCLDIPVLSIHGRKGKSRIWRPGWGLVEVVTPKINVIGGSLRQRLWKYFLSVSAVERGFERLVNRRDNAKTAL